MKTEPGLLCRTHGGVCCQLEEFGRAAVNALGDSGDFRRRWWGHMPECMLACFFYTYGPSRAS
jgi:hypothetical protein